jgi:Ca2+-binding RTX toxin-like protein
MPFQFSESGSDSFVFTSDQTHHVDMAKSLTLAAPSMVEVFTSAQFAGIQLWAVDAANAQALNAGMPFSGVALSNNGQFGLVGLNLPAGTWYFGGLDTAAIPAGGSVGAFVDASVVSSSDATLAGNVPMAVYGNPGSWRAVGFDVSGAPQTFLETEAVGGKFVVMTDAQFQTFQATYAHGYNGGDLTFAAPAGAAGFAAGDQGPIDLTAGRYDLVWINDTNAWSGGAANLSAFSGAAGATGNAAVNNLGGAVAKDLSSPGADDLVANPHNAEIHAGLGNDTITGSTGQDYLRGDEGDDSISGGAGFDDSNGNMGNDTIHGNGGDDWSVGGKDSDLLFGDDGNDVVWGNLGNDTCDGGNGDDQCRGGQGDDSVSGGAGNDFISGDRGNDTETGGAGADNFHTFSGAGIDRVLDFHLSEGDRVMLDPGTVFSVNQVGSDTVVDMGNGDQMILVGVQMSTLTPGWIFGA